MLKLLPALLLVALLNLPAHADVAADFTRPDALKPFAVLRDDPAHYRLDPRTGRLLLRTQRGDTNGPANNEKNLFSVPLPDRNFSVTLSVARAEPTLAYHHVALALFADDDNLARLYYFTDGRARQLGFDQESTGHRTNLGENALDLGDKPFQLRLTRAGRWLMAAHSQDGGKTWHDAGRTKWNPLYKRAGFYAANSTAAADIPEIEVAIDGFNLKELPDAPELARKPNTFYPGETWLDDRNKPIESHFGGVLYDNGTYYWYGDNWDTPTLKPGTYPNQYFSWTLNHGATCYSSKDLYHWKYESVSLAAVENDPTHPLQPTNWLPRPKVLRCDATGKYVMMAQIVTIDFKTMNKVVVGLSDTPAGPFQYHGLLDPPGGGYDITLYKDDDGKAYLVTAHGFVKMHELAADYLSIVKTTEIKGVEGEAPALFKHGGVYYFLTSHMTGLAPNPNKYSVSKSLLGPYEPRGEFAAGPGAANTFASQVTFVLPVAGRPGSFIFMADRMNAVTDALVEDYHESTHVWLPIALDAAHQKISVPWRDEWDLSIFDAAAPANPK
jgi:hypothetical protein